MSRLESAVYAEELLADNGQRGDYQQREMERIEQGKTQKITLVIHRIPITTQVVLIISCHWIIRDRGERAWRCATPPHLNPIHVHVTLSSHHLLVQFLRRLDWNGLDWTGLD